MTTLTLSVASEENTPDPIISILTPDGQTPNIRLRGIGGGANLLRLSELGIKWFKEYIHFSNFSLNAISLLSFPEWTCPAIANRNRNTITLCCDDGFSFDSDDIFHTITFFKTKNTVVIKGTTYSAYSGTTETPEIILWEGKHSGMYRAARAFVTEALKYPAHHQEHYAILKKRWDIYCEKHAKGIAQAIADNA